MGKDNKECIGVYSGDTFKRLIRAYSNARMQRDNDYKQKVMQLLAERDTARQVEKA